MDLAYPVAVQASLVELRAGLAGVVEGGEASVWDSEPGPELATPELDSALAQVVEMRELGACAAPLGGLLRRCERRYLPLPRKWSRGGVTPLGVADATRGWEAAQASYDGKLTGNASVAPFCIPANRMVVLTREGALVKATAENTRVERVGDGFAAAFEDTPAILLSEGDEARQAWAKLVTWERLALVGLTLGVIDRAYRIAYEALGEGKRAGDELADEQVAQFQLSDNYIDRLSAEKLGLDVAIDAEKGKGVDAKLALVRAFTTKQAEACAARALHLAALFTPEAVPVARWLTKRAHELAVFGMAREHEVRAASAGVIAGLSLE